MLTIPDGHWMTTFLTRWSARRPPAPGGRSCPGGCIRPCAGGRSSARGGALEPVLDGDLELGADGVAVAPGALEANRTQWFFDLRVVAEQGGRAVLVVDDDVDVAVVVDVAERRAPAHVLGVEVRARRRGSPAGTACRLVDVAEEQGDLLVVDRLAEQAAVVVDVPVGHEAVGPAVVVEVGQRAAPADPRHGVGRQAEERRDVEEDPLAQVLVERVVLVGEIGDEQLGQAVAIDVLGVHPHPRLRLAVDVVGGARELGDVVERAVAPVEEQEVGVHVVGDVDVDQAVVVDVGRHHAEAVAVVAGARAAAPC